MLFLNIVVFLNNLGAIPLKPTAIESVSNAPIAAPPAIAAPGAFPPLSFISLDISLYLVDSPASTVQTKAGRIGF